MLSSMPRRSRLAHCRIPRVCVSQITWRTRVARQPTEDPGVGTSYQQRSAAATPRSTAALLADDFHECYLNARDDLRCKAESDS